VQIAKRETIKLVREGKYAAEVEIALHYGLKPYGAALPVMAWAGEGPRVAANKASYTGHYLKQVLARRPSSAKRAAAETQAAE
jgi:hypothetical protein